MTMSVDTSRAQLEYTARDWLVNESGLTNKELKFVFTVFPQRNVLTLNDIMNLTEADLPALGFSTIAQSHFLNNLSKLKAKKAAGAAAEQFKPVHHHPNMTSAQITALNKQNKILEQKMMSSFAAAGKQISGAQAAASGGSGGAGGSAAAAANNKSAAAPSASQQVAITSPSPAPGAVGSNIHIGAGNAPQTRPRDDLISDWRNLEGVCFEIHTSLEHVGVKEGRLFTDPFMSDRSLQWRVLPLRRRAVPSDQSLCEWAFIVSPLIAAVDPNTKLVIDDKYDLDFVAQISGYSGSVDLGHFNGSLPVYGDWYSQGQSTAGKLSGIMLRFITKAAPANDYLNIKIKYCVGI